MHSREFERLKIKRYGQRLSPRAGAHLPRFYMEIEAPGDGLLTTVGV